MTPDARIQAQADQLEARWRDDPRWQGIERSYGPEDVVRLRGSVVPESTLARLGAERLWELLRRDEPTRALGALTGGQAVQMVKAGLDAIYLSGWQVAADANLGASTYPDQSLYPANSVPALVKRLNNALQRADQIDWSESRNALVCADPRRRGSRIRWAAERVRADAVDDRGRRGRRALRGPALVREEMRASRREGARAHVAVRPHTERCAPGF
jgi:isocitrate lyase